MIGTGRCGTRYAAELLRSVGCRIGHHALLADGISSWVWALPHRRVCEFSRIVHVVREPLAAIASMHTIRPESWRIIERHGPAKRSQPLTLRAMWHWWHWNLLCQAQADATVRIEDLPLLAEDVFHVPGPYGDVPPDRNSRPHTNLTWDDLRAADAVLAGAVAELAERYGYEVTNV